MADGHMHVELLAAGPQKPISETHRFSLLALGAFACICNSFSYAFNLISGEMQTRYNLSQRDLSTISTVGLVFQYFSLPYGILFDYVGPLTLAGIGTAYFTIGSLLLALCFRGVVEGSVVRLSVFNAFMVTGCSMFDLVACVAVVSYFLTRKGAVVAFLKTFAGLGSAIVGSMYTGFFDGHPDWYYFFLMALVIVVGVLNMIFMRLPPYHLTGYQQKHLSEGERQERLATKVQYLKQNPPSFVLYYGYAIIIILIVYLPLTSALVAYLKLGKSYKVAFGVVAAVLTVLFLLVAFPIMFRRIGECFGYYDKKKNEAAHMASPHKPRDAIREQLREGSVESLNEPTTEISQEISSEESDMPVMDVDYIAPQYHDKFLHNVLTPKLWCVWWASFACGGSIIVVSLNASYIYGALAGEMPSDSVRTMLTVLNGVGSAVGRLLMSFFEAWTQSQPVEKRVPITVVFFLPSVTVVLSTVLFLVLPERALPLPFVIAAFGNGFVASSIVLVMRTLFAEDVAKHYNFVFLSAVASAILLNRVMYGEWYTRQAEKQNNGGQICYGRKCVLMPLLVFLGLACSAVFTSFYLNRTYTLYCAEVLEERRRMREEARQAHVAHKEPAAETASIEKNALRNEL